MLNGFLASGALAVSALSFLPTASAALSWSKCTKDEKGELNCQSRIPRGARIAIAVCCFVVLLLLLALVVCVCIKRRTSDSQDKEYDVEASQVDGPPAIIATQYDPTSGPSRVYSGGPKTAEPDMSRPSTPQPPQMTGPAMPVAAHAYEWRPPAQLQTAPVAQSTFAEQPYPFAYNPENGNYSNPPRTAYVSNGFPRPMLAGERLKGKLKERPSSVSSLTMSDAPPSFR